MGRSGGLGWAGLRVRGSAAGAGHPHVDDVLHDRAHLVVGEAAQALGRHAHDDRPDPAGEVRAARGAVVVGRVVERVDGQADGAAFMARQMAVGASELRDLVASAYREAAGVRVGWPAVAVADVEAGTVDPWVSMIGSD